MLNHITIAGRLTRDPEMRSLPSGTTVATFNVAVERDFGNRESGERQTDFIDCVAWRQTAEFITRNGQKGRLIAISGRLQSRKWETKEGDKRISWEVVADNVYFLDSRRDGESGRDSGYSRSTYSSSYDSGRSSAPAPASNTFVELDDGDGELPF